MEILEEKDHRALRRDPLEERPPGTEQLLRPDGPRLDPKQCQQGWLDPLTLVRIGDPLAHG